MARRFAVGAIAVALLFGGEAVADESKLALVVARRPEVEARVTQGLHIKLSIALKSTGINLVSPQEMGDTPAETDSFLSECIHDDGCLLSMASGLNQSRLLLLVVEPKLIRFALIEPPKSIRRATRGHSMQPPTDLADTTRLLLDGWGNPPPPAEVVGTLVIDGSPAHASVMVDDVEQKLVTPMRLSLKPGHHRIAIWSPGFVPLPPTDVDIKAGRTQNLPYILQPEAGSVVVSGLPSGATVLVDGVLSGTAPITVRGLLPGPHNVEVNARGHRTYTTQVLVTRNASSDVSFDLAPILTSLSVTASARVEGQSIPYLAKVTIDGTRVGTTPWSGKVSADVVHQVELAEYTGNGRLQRSIEVPQVGGRLDVHVPEDWAQAKVALDFVPGPWSVMANGRAIDNTGDTLIRPGPTQFQFLLDGKVVGESRLTLSPGEVRTLRITERPRTQAELESSNTWWAVRKWTALGLALGLGGTSALNFFAAKEAESRRDSALAGISATDDQAEFDRLRSVALAEDVARGRAEYMGLGFLIGAIAAGAWCTAEWLLGEPSPGLLVGDGLTAPEDHQ